MHMTVVIHMFLVSKPVVIATDHTDDISVGVDVMPQGEFLRIEGSDPLILLKVQVQVRRQL